MTTWLLILMTFDANGTIHRTIQEELFSQDVCRVKVEKLRKDGRKAYCAPSIKVEKVIRHIAR